MEESSRDQTGWPFVTHPRLVVVVLRSVVQYGIRRYISRYRRYPSTSHSPIADLASLIRYDIFDMVVF